MAVPKKAKPLDVAAMISGAAHVEAVRGTTNWGANYVFNSGALQGDILALADTVNTLDTRASGVAARTEALAAPSGGMFIKSATSSTGVYQIYYSDTAPTAGNPSGYLHIIPV